ETEAERTEGEQEPGEGSRETRECRGKGRRKAQAGEGRKERRREGERKKQREKEGSEGNKRGGGR
ncbi:hypothetical protein ACC703_39510, partial [Rhizobium ruizarguesonis]